MNKSWWNLIEKNTLVKLFVHNTEHFGGDLRGQTLILFGL